MARIGRPTSLTSKRRAEFLESLSQGASVARAAQPILITRQSLYDHKKKDPEFAAEWDRALETGTDKLEDEARRRAYEGVDEPVFYKGDECGYVRKYSDTLLIFLLKGARPEKYKENSSVILTDQRNIALHIHLAGKHDNPVTQLLQDAEPMVLTSHALDHVSSVEGLVVEVDPTPSTLIPNREAGVGGEEYPITPLPK